MSRVIKNNDGVAIVEGTPAASLVKDVDKFFAAKPPERMAGESIAPVQRDTMLTGIIKDKDGNEIRDRRPTREELDSFLAEQGIFRTREKEGEGPILPRPTIGPEPPPRPKLDPNNTNLKSITKKAPEADNTMFMGGSKDFNEKTGRVEPNFRASEKQEPRARMPGTQGIPRRNEARDKAESRRRRFFERRRSAKEAKRSEREKEATQGRFITTLGR
jgi:hypothetical protein